MRLLLASSDDLHVLPLAALVPLLSTDFDCEHIRLDSRASDATNLARLRTQLEDGANPECTLLGGFSRGARLAAMLSLEISVRGLVGLSFPFHRHGRPAEHHGLDVLKKVLLPTLIIQGTRDSHGNREQVRGMEPLPGAVHIHWLPHANHRWHAKGVGNGSEIEHAKHAAKTIRSFAQHLVSIPHV